MAYGIRRTKLSSNGSYKVKRQNEHSIQVECVKWFRYVYPRYANMLFAVPNGSQREKVTGAKLKAEGVKAGVADLLLLLSRGGFTCLCIEMKTPKGVQSAIQKAWQKEAEENGCRYVICRSVGDFINEVTNYLKLDKKNIEK